MKHFNGTISIARQMGGEDDGCICIEVTDETSRVQFIEIKLTTAELGAALTGSSYRPCKFGLRCVEKVGMKAECKEENVHFTDQYLRGSALDSAKTRALKPFEVDGWIGRREDLGNGHRATKNGYMVHFDRHVAT